MVASDTLDNFGNLFPVPIGTPEQTGLPKNVLRWQTFLKDFITWLVIMFFLYLFWKLVLHPMKLNKMKTVQTV